MAASMTDRIRTEAAIATQMSALCYYLAEALGADPDTCVAGQAVEGLERIAHKLAASLSAIAEESTRR